MMTSVNGMEGAPPYSNGLDYLGNFTLTGDLVVTGGLTVTGSFTFGDAAVDVLTIKGYINFPTSAAVTKAIQVGDSTTSGMPINATKNKMVVLYGTVPTGAVTNTTNLRPIWSRLGITAASVLSGGGCQTAGQFTVMVYGGTTTTLGGWATAGVWGSVADDSVASVSLTGAGSVFTGVLATVQAGTNFTCGSGAITSAVYAEGNTATGATMTGDFAGVYITKASGTKSFTTGLQIASAVSTTGIAVGTTTTAGITVGASATGVYVSGTMTTASSRSFKGCITVNNANYTDGYGSIESELTLTGTVAGVTSAMSSWINMITVTASNQHIYAQSNGLYSEVGGVLTGGVFVFGLAMDCLLNTNGGAVGATYYPFKCINAVNVTSAIFLCNDATSDLGEVASISEGTTSYIPIFSDNEGKRYVKCYKGP